MKRCSGKELPGDGYVRREDHDTGSPLHRVRANIARSFIWSRGRYSHIWSFLKALISCSLISSDVVFPIMREDAGERWENWLDSVRGRLVSALGSIRFSSGLPAWQDGWHGDTRGIHSAPNRFSGSRQ